MTKYLDLKEFREGGYLQELNRRFLHPLGLALEMKIEDDGSTKLSGIWDYRDDSEGIHYLDSVDLKPKEKKINQEWIDREPSRQKALGYMVQPTK